MTNNNTTTEQVKGPRKLKNGNPINISAQFGQPNGNPRHNGCWKKEDTPRYKLEKMMAMTEDELHSVALDKTASLFERKLALAISKADWKTIESMVNQVYGVPKAEVKADFTGDVELKGIDVTFKDLSGDGKK